VNPDDKTAEMRALLVFGIEIIECERSITYESNKEADGVVRDYQMRRELAKFDRWLKRAKKVLA
jgi:hypothetical protein